MRLIAAALMLLPAFLARAAETAMSLDVDAVDLPRKLLRATMEIPVAPGENALWYPKWIPGIHFFGGPVHNLTGILIETSSGEELPWRRDETEHWRFLVDVPEGEDRVVVRLDYIANQPSAQSVGVDSYGYPDLGVINLNTCLLYPEGFDSRDIEVRMRLRLPEGWRAATSLARDGDENDWIAYEAVTLEDIVDSPILCGRYLKTIPLAASNGPMAYLHVAGSTESAVETDDAIREEFTRLMAEAYALFGGAPFDEYHFLLALSDDIPRIGLEHLRSSLNAEGERDLVDADKRKDGVAYLLPHELAHAWCGKWRRPEGMTTARFHEPLRTSQLWIYEGLDQYLGEVLMVRAGLVSEDEYFERFALKVLGLMEQRGREWRSLEDTAVFAGPLRGASPSWGSWRRGQDYYNEGLLIWLEADAYIRRETGGRRSLDDFCRDFFASSPAAGSVSPFAIDDLCRALNEIAPRDWDAFFRERVSGTQAELSTDFVGMLGYRIAYVGEPSAARKKLDGDRRRVDLRESVGLIVGDDGAIEEVIPGGSGDKAGLAPGMEIAAIDGWRFTRDRFVSAIKGASGGSLPLLALHGDRYLETVLGCDKGLRYITLERDEDLGDDRFRAILRPRTPRD